jgi:hypothetical protein
MQPTLAWLEGWLTEQKGDPEQAREIYQRGEETASTQSPVHTARLLLAYGRLLQRTGDRRGAVERLRRPATCTRRFRRAVAAADCGLTPVN